MTNLLSSLLLLLLLTPADPTPTPTLRWEAAPRAAVDPNHPLAACEVRRYETGWVIGECADASFIVLAGFAGQMGPSRLVGVVGDRLGHESRPTKLRVAGRKVSAWELTRRAWKEVSDVLGVHKRPDPQGKVLGRTLLARLPAAKPGPIAIACHGPAERYDANRCAKLISTIARHGVPGGAPAISDLRVGPVKLQLNPRRCWAPSPRRVMCFGDGGLLSWARGETREMAALKRAAIHGAPLAPRSRAERQRLADEVNKRAPAPDLPADFKLPPGVSPPGFRTRPATADDFPEMRMELHRAACTIGGVAGKCTRVDYYGALTYPAERHYYARIPDGDSTVLATCRHSAHESAPTPCRQVFGKFVVAPTPRP